MEDKNYPKNYVKEGEELIDKQKKWYLSPIFLFVLIVAVITFLIFLRLSPEGGVCDGTDRSNITPNVYEGAEVSYSDLPLEAQQAIENIRRGEIQGWQNPHTLRNDPNIKESDNKMLLPVKSDPAYYTNSYVLVAGDNDTYSPEDTFGKKRLVFGKSGEFYYTFTHHKCFSRVIGIPEVENE